jgi:predicted oxidoreductase
LKVEPEPLLKGTAHFIENADHAALMSVWLKSLPANAEPRLGGLNRDKLDAVHETIAGG